MAQVNLGTIMGEVFQRDDGTVPEDAEINKISGWDSLAHITLMVELQNRGLPIDPMDIPELTSYSKIKEFLQSNGYEIV